MKPAKSVVVAKSADLSRLRETKFFQAIGPDSKYALSLRMSLSVAQASGKPFDGSTCGPGPFFEHAKRAYYELTQLNRTARW